MTKAIKKWSPWNVVLFLCAVVITLFATYKTIYYGCDIDESYAITLSYRIVMGDHLFKEMWEVHQTSAIFMAPFIWIYRIVVGNTIGMVAYLRLVGCIIQFFVAIGLYRSLSRHMDKRSACILAFIFYNFSPKFLNVLEFCFLQYLFLTVILICFLNYMHAPKTIDLIVMGAALACTVLAYPQTIFMVIVEYIVLWFVMRKKEGKQKAVKNLLIIFATEAVFGIAFLIYILCNVSVKELLANVPMILADQSHSMGLGMRLWSLVTEFFMVNKWLLVLLAVYELICFITKKRAGKDWVMFIFLIIWMIPMLIYDGQPGIRHLDTFYLINAALLGIGYLNIRFSPKNEMTFAIRLMELLMLSVFLGCCVGSNLTIYANSGLLMPVLFLVWVEYLLNRSQEKTDRQWAGLLFLLLLCVGFLTARCTLVRFTSVQPKTIFEEMYQIGVGPAKGLYVTEKEHIQYHSKMATVQNNVGVEDTVFYMGSDTYQYFFVGNQIAVPTSISTPIFDATVIEYYKRYPYKMPNKIIVDKYYVNLSRIKYDGEFGAWLRENYDLENIVDEDFAQVVYRK